MIAEGFARLARDDCLESPTLSVVRSLVDHDLALTVSLRDLAGEFAKQRPIQARERRVVEMAFENGDDVCELTIAMCRRLVELTAAAHRTIAVVVGMALEFPLVRHFFNLQGSSLRFGRVYELGNGMLGRHCRQGVRPGWPLMAISGPPFPLGVSHQPSLIPATSRQAS